jgi:hypothetical protein
MKTVCSVVLVAIDCGAVSGTDLTQTISGWSKSGSFCGILSRKRLVLGRVYQRKTIDGGATGFF